MAKVIYDANKYPVGTTLTSLGAAISTNGTHIAEFTVTEIGATGRKYWLQTTGNSNGYLHLSEFPGNSFDVLCYQDFTPSEVSALNAVVDVFIGVANTGSRGFNRYRVAVNASTDAITKTVPAPIALASTQKDEAITGFLASKVTALRVSGIGTAFKARVWQADQGGLEAAEPATWNYEATLTNSVFTNSWVSTGQQQDTAEPFRFTAISIGTDGHLAEFSIPEQTVTTPSNLTVNNITPTTADLDWV